MCRSRLVRKMCNLSCKKASMLVCGGFLVIFFTTYAFVFNHGPPENIMAQNKGGRGSGVGLGMKRNRNSYEDLDELEQEAAEEARKAAEYWEKFIKDHSYVAIGELYDNCDENDRTMIGRTIMLPEKHWGGIKGVKSRTFVNITLDEELNDGKFFIEVQYNGNDLFSRSWDLCTLDEDYGDDRIIYCPFEPGEYSFVKDRSIPIYLPRGRYTTKGWITDGKDEIIACGFSDFTL